MQEIPICIFLENFSKSAPQALPQTIFNAQGDKNSELNLLTDLRGRPADTLEPKYRATLVMEETPVEEEIFYAEGQLINTSKPSIRDCATDNQNSDIIPFHFQLNSRFKTFAGTEHIVHQIIPKTSTILREISSRTSPKLLSRMLPARLEKFRFGIESYRSKSLGSALGLVPIVESRFYLEADTREIKITAKREIFRKSKYKLPFEEEQIFASIDQALRKSGLFSNFSQEVETAINKYVSL